MDSFRQFLIESETIDSISLKELERLSETSPKDIQNLKSPLKVLNTRLDYIGRLKVTSPFLVFADTASFHTCPDLKELRGSFPMGLDVLNCDDLVSVNVKAKNGDQWHRRPVVDIQSCRSLKFAKIEADSLVAITHCKNLEEIDLSLSDTNYEEKALILDTCHKLRSLNGKFPGSVDIAHCSGLTELRDLEIASDIMGDALTIHDCTNIHTVQNVKLHGKLVFWDKESEKAYEKAQARAITGHSSDSSFMDLFDL